LKDATAYALLRTFLGTSFNVGAIITSYHFPIIADGHHHINLFKSHTKKPYDAVKCSYTANTGASND